MQEVAKIYCRDQFEPTHAMENVIYNDLRMRGYSVDMGVISVAEKAKDGKKTRKQLEVDFVCNLGTKRYYIQSAYSIPDEEKWQQEVKQFTKIDDSFKKNVITRDIVPTQYDDREVLTIAGRHMDQFNIYLLDFYNTADAAPLMDFLYEHTIQGIDFTGEQT